MTLSSKSEASTESVVINDLLEESLASFYVPLKEKAIVPTIHLTNKKNYRSLNAVALSRIFTNLLTNVTHFSDGDLTVTPNETGEISFSNTAVGFNEVQVGKLFNRFYAVDTAHKSTGLGLAISQLLLAEMNGTLTAHYHQNKLTIIIHLPE